MPAVAEPIQDIDLSVLEDIFNADSPKCDIHTCDNDATHVITCQCGEGTENICARCLQQTLLGVKLRISSGIFTFDKTCGHACHVSKCTIRPI